MLRVFRHYMSVTALCLFVCEGCVVGLILSAAANSLAPQSFRSGDLFELYFALVVVPALLIPVVMYALGLYDRQHLEDFRGSLPRLATFLCVLAPLAILLPIWNELTSAGGDATAVWPYVSWTAALFVAVLLARLIYVSALRRALVTPHRILVVGTGRLAADLEFSAQERKSRPTIVGYVPLTKETTQVPAFRVVECTKSVLEAARMTAAKEIVVALDDRRGVALGPLLEARMEGIKITNYLSFLERETRRVNLKALDPSWLIYSDGFRVGTSTNGILKRALDILASLALLVLTLPTMLLVALAIRLESRGPICYRQERVGRHGAIFTIYKFRTMRVDAEESGLPQWASVRDPRVTRVGAFLRMMRIDELPQTLNVLLGDMSFVGPRPERPFFVESLCRDIPFYSERHRVRPGITGWAQINYPYGASIHDAGEKFSYDLYYIKNYSFFFDLLIILSTAQVILFGKGSR